MASGLRSPIVARMELAAICRERRADLRLEAQKVYGAVGASRNWLSGLENARSLPTEDMLRRLADVLDLGEDIEHLVELLRLSREPRWWDEYAKFVAPELISLCGLEHGARGLQIFEPVVVTGLLQTEAYARTLIESNVELSKLTADRHVELRLRRQQRLYGSERLQLRVVQGQAALHQEIGGPGVLREQLIHLVEVVRGSEGAIDFRVVPWASTPAGYGVLLTSILFDLDSRHLTTVSYSEALTAMSISGDIENWRVIETFLELLAHVALSGPDSLALVERRIEELASAGA